VIIVVCLTINTPFTVLFVCHDAEFLAGAQARSPAGNLRAPAAEALEITESG
jgi:hypothetical protein